MRRTLVMAAAAAAFAAAAAAANARPVATLRYDVASQTSSNWAGYAVASGDPATGAAPTTFTNVSGSWTQPAATCTRGVATYSAFWVGLGGFADGSQALEQTGTESDCTATGRAVYSVWYEIIPAPAVTVRMTVRPGDVMTANVSVSGQTVTLQLTNTTRGTTFTKQIAVAAPDLSSAEWIAEAPSTCSSAGCRPLPLANFGTVTFSSATATGNGHAGTISDPAWTATAVSLQGTPAYRSRFRGRFAGAAPVGDATPAPLSADGSSFAVAWSSRAST